MTAEAVVDTRTGERFARDEMALTGGHNALNVAAAIACVAALRRAARDRAAHPPRLPWAASPDGARRRGTRGPLLRRLEGNERGRRRDGARRPARGRASVLIAGGRDKGGSYAPLVEALASKGARPSSSSARPRRRIARAIGGRVPVAARRLDGRGRAASAPALAAPGRRRAALARPARASTCSATTSTAATSSSARVRVARRRRRQR